MQKHLFLYAWLLAIALIALLVSLGFAMDALLDQRPQAAIYFDSQLVKEVLRHAAI